MKRLALLLTFFCATPTLADEPTLQALHYDLLLGDHCGLMSQRALTGYKLGAAAAANDLTAEQQVAARHAAGIAFELEYHNRGLGGSRAWCRDEGAEGIERLSALAPQG